MKLFKRFKKFSYLLQHLYEKVTTSIAFLPTLLAIGFFMLTTLMIYLESIGMTAWVEKKFPSFLIIKSWDIAQSVLTTLVGALISLMVFSFSMVMVLLNNAASNYSPRILPSLIANKFHQIVLGTYLGTIIYCLLLVINMTPSQPKIPLPGISVLLGIILGILCLMLFILFIHSISESVQVNKVLKSLYSSTLENLSETKINLWAKQELPYDAVDWQGYTSDRSGSLKSIDLKSLDKICKESNFKIKIMTPISRFVFEGTELFTCSEPIEKKLQEKILKLFVMATNEYAEDEYAVGFKQITEIAVKAMSPGINDPGTALSAINYLTILFSKLMMINESGAILSKDSKPIDNTVFIWLTIVRFEDLLYTVLASLRQYSKHDAIVSAKIAEMLQFLKSRSCCSKDQKDIIDREIDLLKVDAKAHLTNPGDFNKIFYSKKKENLQISIKGV